MIRPQNCFGVTQNWTMDGLPLTTDTSTTEQTPRHPGKKSGTLVVAGEEIWLFTEFGILQWPSKSAAVISNLQFAQKIWCLFYKSRVYNMYPHNQHKPEFLFISGNKFF